MRTLEDHRPQRRRLALATPWFVACCALVAVSRLLAQGLTPDTVPPWVDLDAAARLYEWVEQLQEPVPTAPFHPSFVPRDRILAPAGSSEEAPREGLPVRRWPPEAYREDHDPDRFRVLGDPEPDAFRESISRALAAPSEPSARAVGPGPGALGAAPGEWSPVYFGIDAGSRNVAGRATSIQRVFDPTQGLTTTFLGSVGGGLWKVGVVFPFAFWVPVSFSLPGSPSVGAFLVRPSAGAQILVGSGDHSRGIVGDGLYRSLDGGATWTRRPLSPTPSWIYRIRADVANDAIVVAATSAGVFRSTNFGETWTRVTTTDTTDLLQDPVYPDFWYAAVRDVGVRESSDNALSFHPFGAGCVGIPGTFGRTSLALSPSAVNWVFALVANGGSLNGIYRSANFGCTWTPIDPLDTNSWGQAFHANAIAVDPSTPQRVFVGMGGAQWTENALAASPCWIRNFPPSDCGDPRTFDPGHADQTDFLFLPGATQVMIASDGGIFRFDWSTGSIVDVGNDLGLQITQSMNALDTLTSAAGDPDLLLAGLQDNGVIRVDGSQATYFRGGDGGQVCISPDNVDHFSYSYGLGWRREVSFNGGATGSLIDCGLAPGVTPPVLREQTPGIPASAVFLFTVAPDPGSGGAFVWYKPPTAACDWQKAHASPLPVLPVQITQSNDPQDWRIWAMSWLDRRVWVLEGMPGSMTVSQRTPPGLEPPLASDSRVFADRSALQPRTAYYSTAWSRPSRAFVTTDRGLTWREVTGNLGLITGNADFFEVLGDPRDLSTLVAATSVGVFRTDSGDRAYPNWYRYMEGLPATPLAMNLDLAADGLATPKLRLGTYGYSFWERELGPTGFLFADGFEAGSLIAWSSSVP